MKIVFLGTSAAEWYPSPWCRCRHCKAARESENEKDKRACSSIWLEPGVLVDIPPDIASSASRFRVDLSSLRAILVTHPHDDHLYPRFLAQRWTPKNPKEEFPVAGTVTELSPLPIYGSEASLEKIRSFLPMPPEEIRLDLKPLKLLSWAGVCDGVKVLPLPANHMVGTGAAFIYIIEAEGKRLLYAVDTGSLGPLAMAPLKGLKLDAVVCEATSGLAPSPPKLEHMNLEVAKKFRLELISVGTISPETPFVLTHLSPHWFPPHSEIAEKLAPDGMIVAYDGLAMEV